MAGWNRSGRKSKINCRFWAGGAHLSLKQPTDDSALLRQYAEDHSDEAFAALVTRHINLVYSVALRHVGNPQNAEEITQAVFIILSKKAASLRHDKALSSWLFQATRLTANNFVRSETRRHRREEEAHMQSVLDEAGTEVWPRIAPLLDTAVAGLREKDRQAIVLRFYEGRNLREVGLALGASEDAAEKRVSRALEKLRKFFAKRGVSSTTAILAGAVAANSVQAAPVALAKSVTAVAVVKGSMAAASTLALVKGTVKIMTWTKLKFALGGSVAALLAGGAITIALSQTNSVDNLPPKAIVQKTMDKYASLTSYNDTGKYVSVRNGKTNILTTFKIQLGRPNFYRFEFEITMFPAVPARGAVWSAGKGDYAMFGDNNFGRAGQTEKLPDMKSALQRAAMAGRGAANAFFDLGGSLNALASGAQIKVERQRDERIGGVDCYVIAGTQNNLTRTVWIGKRDFLLHQNQTVQKAPMRMAADHATLDKEFERQAKDLLTKMNRDVTPAAIAAKKAEIWQAMKEANSSTIIQTETHLDIVVNQNFSPDDFQIAQ
jgi:RNA polymerase sigma factor (sigma-70 family)